MRSLKQSLTAKETAKQLAFRYGIPIANGDYAIFPVTKDGQCLIRKNLEEAQVSEESFNHMLNAGTGLLMVIAYGRMAGILGGQDFLDTEAYERALNLLPHDPLCQPRNEARSLFTVQKDRLRTEINS